MRTLTLILLLLALSVPVTFADDKPETKKPATPKPLAVTPDRFSKGEPFPEVSETKAALQELVALMFVRQHDPELATLIERLKDMKPHEYARAIREVYQVSQNLNRLKENDPKRYAIGLEAWKAKSRVEVLAARLANSPSGDLEDQLRAAVEKEFDVNLRRQTVEREFVQDRLKKLDATIERLQKNRDKAIEQKYQFLFRKSMAAGNFDTGAATTATPDPKKGKGKK